MSHSIVETAVDRLLHEASHVSSTDHDDGGSGFNYVAFWVINSIILVIILALALWCCKLGGADFVVRCADRVVNTGNSDLEYARRVLERQRQKEEKEKESPEERKARLLESFQRCNSTMVGSIER